MANFAENRKQIKVKIKSILELIDSIEDELVSDSSEWGRSPLSVHLDDEYLQNCLDDEEYEGHKHRAVCLKVGSILDEQECKELLPEDVFDRMVQYFIKLSFCCEDSIQIPFKTIEKFPLHKIEHFIIGMITMVENDMTSCDLQKLYNTNWMIQALLKKFRCSLNPPVIDRMFDCSTKLILKFSEMKLLSFDVKYNEFPLSKLQSSLPPLIDLIENELEIEGYNLYILPNMNRALEHVLNDHKDELDSAIINRMFDYIKKQIYQCKSDFFVKELFCALPSSALESSLLILIESLERELQTEQNCDWHRHRNMSELINEVLRVHQKLLDKTAIDQTFDYLVGIIRNCENVSIDGKFWCVIEAFSRFTATKLASSLPSLITAMATELETQQSNMFRHRTMSQVIELVLTKHLVSLKASLIDQMFDYLIKLINLCEDEKTIHHSFCASQLLPLSKLQSSVPQLISSIEGELETELFEWHKHKCMSEMIEQVYTKHRASLPQIVINRIFVYFMKLISKCKMSDITYHAFKLLSNFLTTELESLPQVISSFENDLKSEQLEWYKYKNVADAIDKVLKQHQNTMDDDVMDQVFGCLEKLIHHSKDDIIELDEIKYKLGVNFDAFIHFPFEKLQSLLPQMIDSMESELENEQCDWNKHENMCRALEKVLIEHRDSFNPSLIDQMFDYVAKVIQQEDTIKCGIWAFPQFSLNKLQSSLPQLIDSISFDLETEHYKWYKHRNMSKVIQEVLIEHRDSLEPSLIDQMFEYLTKLICKFKNMNEISGVFVEFPLSKLQPKLHKLIQFFENELQAKQCEWYKHQNMSKLIEEVLKKHHTLLDKAVIDRMFEYYSKLIHQCDEENMIPRVIAEFPLSKLESSMPQLIGSIEGELDAEQCQWHKHRNLSMAIEEVLKNHPSSFDKTLDDELFSFFDEDDMEYDLDDYKKDEDNEDKDDEDDDDDADEEILFLDDEEYEEDNDGDDKNVGDDVDDDVDDNMDDDEIDEEDYEEDEEIQFLDDEEFDEDDDDVDNEEFDDQDDEEDMDTDDKNYDTDDEDDWDDDDYDETLFLSPKDTIPLMNQIFNYCLKLINRFDVPIHTMMYAITAITKFPIGKLASLMDTMIDSLESEFISKSFKWTRHQNLCSIIRIALNNEELLNSKIIMSKITNYIMKLIETCDHSDTSEFIISVFLKFPDDKFRFLLLKSINSVEFQLKPKLQENKLFSLLDGIYISSLEDIEKPTANPILLQNLCLLIKQIKWNDVKFSLGLKNVVLEYLVGLIDNQRTVEMLTATILAIESIAYRMNYGDKQLLKELLVTIGTKVQNLTTFSANVSIAKYSVNDFDLPLYKFVWCARWFVQYMLTFDGVSKSFAKISTDRLCARNDQNFFPTVRSAFAVHYGVYFYEAVLLSGGQFQIGWTTREARFVNDDNAYLGIGDDAHSIGFDASNSYIWHCKIGHRIPNLSKWNAGDVVGCLIDHDSKRFVFYLNGRQFECSGKINFSSQPYFAGASLTQNQQCYFNFGQHAFKFPPNGLKFSSFYMSSNKDINKYGLLDTCMTIEIKRVPKSRPWSRKNKYQAYYWFKNLAIENNIEPFFFGQNQNISDSLIQLAKNDFRFIDILKLDRYLINDQYMCLRFIQSIIEILDVQTFKIDIIAKWIGDVIRQNILQTPLEKLCEFIYPYLRLKTSSNISQYRNIRMILSNLIQLERQSKCASLKYLRKETFTCLNDSFSKTNDNLTKLFALIGLADWEIAQEELVQVITNDKIKNFAHWWDNIRNEQIYTKLALEKSKPTRIDYQIFFCSQYLFNHLSSFNPLSNMNKIAGPITRTKRAIKSSQEENRSSVALNPRDRTERVKLSSDLLSVRSDSLWQSVRSKCSTNLKSFYYEVVLVTNGDINIGWAPKDMDLNHFAGASITFNGFKQLIIHKNHIHSTSHVPQWQEGDVIGCLIDVHQKKFNFYHNGLLLDLPSDIFFSTKPYHALINLAPHQHCYVNFGQSKFECSIKDIEYESFCRQNILPNLEIINSIVDSSLLVVNSTANIGDINIASTSRKNILVSNDEIWEFSQPETSICLTSNMENSNSNRPKSCAFCGKAIQGRAIQFVGCEHSQFCNICMLSTNQCSKCDESLSQIAPTSNSNWYQMDCQICGQPDTNSRLLQFVSCDHWKLCRACLQSLSFCAKCNL